MVLLLTGCYEWDKDSKTEELPSRPAPTLPEVPEGAPDDDGSTEEPENEADPGQPENTPPAHAAASVTFIGTATAGAPNNLVRGELRITRASDESNIEKYHVYWIDHNSNRVLQTPFLNLNKTGNDLNYEIANDIDIPTGANRFLVVTANNFGEMSTGVSVVFACDDLALAAPNCTSCVNPKHTGASCNLCASPHTNFPACDTCLDEKHTGEACGECKPQFKQDTYPSCNQCVNTFLGENCASCIFPLADYSTFCTTCTQPLRTPPRCLR